MGTVLKALYWFVVGGLVGLGAISILSVGALMIVLGPILAVAGAIIRLGVREAWAALLGGGLVPLALLPSDLQNPDIQPAATGQTYEVMALIFGGIALLGLFWGLVAALASARSSARAG